MQTICLELFTCDVRVGQLVKMTHCPFFVERWIYYTCNLLYLKKKEEDLFHYIVSFIFLKGVCILQMQNAVVS